MSAIHVAIQRCIDEGWYEELRARAPYWIGYFPVDQPELQAELSRCATLPKEDNERLRALLAVWQVPPWSPSWGSVDLQRAANARKSAWANQGPSPTTRPAASPPPSPTEPSVEPAAPMQDAVLPELGYLHVRVALLQLIPLLSLHAGELSKLHRARDNRAILALLAALAQVAGLLDQSHRGRPKRPPKPEYLRELNRQTVWLLSKIDEWRDRVEGFVAEARNPAEDATAVGQEAPGGQGSDTLSLDQAWAIRFPMLTRDEMREVLDRDYRTDGNSDPIPKWLIERVGFDPSSLIADWLIARRLGFDPASIRQRRGESSDATADSRQEGRPQDDAGLANRVAQTWAKWKKDMASALADLERDEPVTTEGVREPDRGMNEERGILEQRLARTLDDLERNSPPGAPTLERQAPSAPICAPDVVDLRTMPPSGEHDSP